MKTLKSILLITLFCLLGTQFSEAQVWKKLKKGAEKAAERAVIRKTEQKVTKETEKGMDSILNPNTGKRRKNKRGNRKNNETSSENDSNQNSEEDVAIENSKAWSKYNFVPGDEIIFEDDLKDEENGEFPSRWDLNKGNAENASLGNENIIRLEKNSIIKPLMDTKNYLPEVFTIEFDAYFDHEIVNYQAYEIRFWDNSDYLNLPNKDQYRPITIQSNGAKTEYTNDKARKNLTGFDPSTIGNLPTWKHIAISFNKRTLKVFVDGYRALNIPNYKLKPELFTIESYLWSSPRDITFAIKNIRVAKGGKDLYDRVLADGKFVTRGILFDVNKATIQKESYGVLNEVAKMMKKHEALNFKVEGHTDSDGADDYNLKLSANRAIAVKNALQEMGISEDRFQTEGKGETTPVSENTSSEGKANNRRVEFIQIK